MKILTTNNLSVLLNLTERYIRKKSKDSNQNYIIIKDKQYYFRKKLVGKGYEFCELPFNESSTVIKDSLNSNLIDKKICSTATTTYNLPKKETPTVVELVSNRALVDNFDEDKQNEALEKVEIVKSWLKAKEEKIKKEDFLTFINQKSSIKDITNKKLKDWCREYLNNGIYGLIDKRGNKKGNTILSNEYKNFIVKHIEASQAGIINVAEIYRNLHDYIFMINGEANSMLLFMSNNKKYQLYSVDTVRREIERYKKENPLKFAQITRGYDRAKSAFDSAYGSMDNALYRCEEFQLDMTPANFMVKDENGKVYRPKLTTVIDTFSRRGIMIISETANSYTAVKALIKAIEKLGTPTRLKTDNGKDYKSNHFRAYLTNLSIEHNNTGVGSGRENAFVERLHQLQDKNLKYIDNYLGRNVGERTAQEQQTPKKDRLKGKVEKTHQLVEISLNEAIEMTDKVVELNDISYHSILKTTPLEKYNRDKTPISFIPKDRLLAFAGKTGLRKYSKEGISINNINFRQVEAHNKLVGKNIRYYENIENENEIFIFLDGEYQGKAYSEFSNAYSIKDYLKANRELDKELRNNKKQFDESRKFISETIKNGINTKYELAVKNGVFDRPKNEEVYISPFIEESIEVVKQMNSSEIDFKEIDNQNKGGLNVNWDEAIQNMKDEISNNSKRKIG